MRLPAGYQQNVHHALIVLAITACDSGCVGPASAVSQPERHYPDSASRRRRPDAGLTDARASDTRDTVTMADSGPPGDTHTPIDIGTSADEGTTADTGSGIDSPMIIDTRPTTDTGVIIDTGTIVDTRLIIDAGAIIDTVTFVDASVVMDVGTVIDASARIDSGTITDTAASLDTRPPIESGPILDVPPVTYADTIPDRPVIADVAPVTDTFTAADSGSSEYDGGLVARSVIPRINAPMKSRLRTLFLAGQAMGNRPAVFSKVGDSITSAGAFLAGIGCSEEILGDHPEVAPTIAYFRATTFPPSYTSTWCGAANAFSLGSRAASSGWTVVDVTTVASLGPDCPPPYDTPLRCEYHRTRPSIALIMFGSNDVARLNDLSLYRAGLERIVSETIAAGVIPVLSTIPPRLDAAEFGARVGSYNDVVMAIARASNIPLWDYFVALTDPSMINQGISSDGVHPSSYGECTPPLGCASETYSVAALRYGFNVRNLTALQILAKLKSIVFEDGSPDP